MLELIGRIFRLLNRAIIFSFKALKAELEVTSANQKHQQSIPKLQLLNYLIKLLPAENTLNCPRLVQ